MSTSTDSSALELVGKFAVSMTLVFLGFLMRGWVASHLWNWFIAAPFNAPILGVWSAVGFGTVVSIFTIDFSKTLKQDDKEWGASALRSLSIIGLAYPVMLGMGYLIHLAV